MTQELQQLMDKYNLTVKDLPLAHKTKGQLKRIIITIGEAKQSTCNKNVSI